MNSPTGPSLYTDMAKAPPLPREPSSWSSTTGATPVIREEPASTPSIGETASSMHEEASVSSSSSAPGRAENPPEEPEKNCDSSRGVVRVLIVGAGPATDSSAGTGVPGGHSWSDSAGRIEKWCRRCGISNVTILGRASCTGDFRASAASFHKGCQPGDTLVLALDGLDYADRGDVEERAPDSSLASALLADCLQLLPSNVTVLLISDSTCNVDLPLQQDKSIRLVHFHLQTEDPGCTNLCSSALLRAADALSLADGPCSLSCQEFFAEMEDQAQDLAAAFGVPLSATLAAYPDDSVAQSVRWPIAAAPRELGRTAGVPPNAAPAKPATRAGRLPPRITGLGSSASSSQPLTSLASVLVNQPAQGCGAAARAPSLASKANILQERRPRSAPRRDPRAVPGNIGDLSAMLVGGRPLAFPRTSPGQQNRERLPAQEVYRESGRRG